MAIIVYNDVIMPNSVLLAGLRGRQVRKNTRIQSQAGRVQVNVDWARTLREYEIGFVPMRLSSWQAIEGLHEVTEGGAFGFLMEDPKDNTITQAQSKVASITSTTFQMQKVYTSVGSTRTKDRKITRPKASTVVVYNTGVPMTVGTDYTLDADTGVITIPAAPIAAAITWSGQFYVPVHFVNDIVDWELVAAGPSEIRMLAGPMTTLMEVRE